MGVAALVVAVALMGAACGSSEGGSGGGGSSNTTGATGTPVVLGGAGTLKGYEGIAEGAQARIDRANAEGGVQGHPIQFLGFKDDGGDPNKADTNVRQLVQQDNIDAAVPVIPFRILPQTAQFMEDSNVPWTAIGAAQIMCDTQGGFAFNGCNVPGLSKSNQDSFVQWYPKALGKENLDGVKFAVVGLDVPGGDAFRNAQADSLKKLGAEIVYNEGGIPFGATNVQTFVDAVMASNPDAVNMVTDLATVVAVQGGLKAAGFKGQLFNAAGYVPGVLESSPDTQKALEGSFIATSTPTPQDETEFSKQMVADFEAAGVKPTYGAIQGYLSVDIYLQLLENAGGDASKVIEDGNAGFTFDQPNGGFTLSFPEGHTQSAPCSGMVQVKGTEYVSIAQFACQD